MNHQDTEGLRTAITAALAGRGYVEPNPMVGATAYISTGDSFQLLATAWHEKFGGDHAEIALLKKMPDRPMQDMTICVTLEPCCHTHKKTPPCVHRLIESGIRRVVIGCLDPNPQVNGKGVSILREAGIEVVIADGEMADRCRELIGPFTLRQRFHRPYITMKWAETADGKIAGHEGLPIRITGDEADCAVHWLRTRSDAIIIGINTAMNDDPLLTVRGVEVIRTPERIVLDHKLRLPTTSRLVQTALITPTVVIASLSAPAATFESLIEKGVRVVWPPAEREDLLYASLSAGQYVKNTYTNVLIEPGPTLARSVFKSGLCDRLWVFRSTRRLDDRSAPSASAIPDWFAQTAEMSFGPDTLCEYLNTQSPVFYTADRSFDAGMIDPAAGDNSKPQNEINR